MITEWSEGGSPRGGARPAPEDGIEYREPETIKIRGQVEMLNDERERPLVGPLPFADPWFVRATDVSCRQARNARA